MTGRCVLCFLCIVLAIDSAAAAAPTHRTTINGRTFTLPDGFEIELVAGPPLVQRPIAGDFDDQGRLYVTESSGSNDKVEVQLQKKPHRILCLEDSKGTGRFDQAHVFAAGMMLPEGVLWHEGSLFVSAPPSIWKLTDTDGSGKATQREEWFKGQTLTGCANDLHGPYLGPDGWIYWCKGAFARQTVPRPGRKPLITRAAHIFRCRPDGSGQEAVMNGGMDNPVDVVFTPGGERIFTTTFFQHPEGGQRDGLIHAIYGGVYGKDHDVIHEHPWTAPALMPVMTHLGPAAPAGLHRLESAALGQEYQNNLFAANFNLRKVTRHVLIPDGATFRTRDEDFLVCDHLDFHPTDVIEDADGSLLVIDTGGWYKLCCPTSQLVKPDVTGGIYRIRRHNAVAREDPRGLKIDWKASSADLTRLLDDPRPVVRKRALATLARRSRETVADLARVMEKGATAEARRNAVWTLTRIDAAVARDQVRQALADADAEVRQAALHSISVWRDKAAVPQLIAMLRNTNRHNRRAAAEALGRIGDPKAVPAILLALADENDRTLEHSLTFALLEIASPDQTMAGLRNRNPRVQRSVLMALDQMEGGGLQADAVVKALAAEDQSLRETATWIVKRHPEWGAALVAQFRAVLEQKRTDAQQEEFVGLLAQLARSEAIQSLLTQGVVETPENLRTSRTCLQAMARSGLRTIPSGWYQAVQIALDSNKPSLWQDGFQAARSMPPPQKVAPEYRTALLRHATTERHDDRQRLTALAVLAALPGSEKFPDAEFTLALERLHHDQPAPLRSLAAEVLTRVPLESDQLLRLAEALATTSPLELSRLLEAFGRSTEEPVGLKLVAVLRKPEIRAGLRSETVRQHLKAYGPAVQKEADRLYVELDAALKDQRARLDKMLAELKEGDVRRGQQVFHQTKAACASCHKIGYVGGTVGPDLTRVGAIRGRRDLLESILFPSSSFTRSYEPFLVTTIQGQTYNGIIKKDGLDEIVLTIAADRQVRILRENIEEMRPGQVSLMPSGLDQQLSPQDLADLLAFLGACK